MGGVGGGGGGGGNRGCPRGGGGGSFSVNHGVSMGRIRITTGVIVKSVSGQQQRGQEKVHLVTKLEP